MLILGLTFNVTASSRLHIVAWSTGSGSRQNMAYFLFSIRFLSLFLLSFFRHFRPLFHHSSPPFIIFAFTSSFLPSFFYPFCLPFLFKFLFFSFSFFLFVFVADPSGLMEEVGEYLSSYLSAYLSMCLSIYSYITSPACGSTRKKLFS